MIVAFLIYTGFLACLGWCAAVPWLRSFARSTRGVEPRGRAEA